MKNQMIKILNAERHGKLKLKLTDYEWSRGLHTIPVTLSEVHDVSNTFPIVFTNEDKPKLIMVVAVGNDRNLGLDEKGKWTETYVPGFLQRYPFYLSRVAGKKGEDEKLVLAIDEESKFLNEKNGTALFEEGKPSAFVKKMINFLGTLEKEMLATADMGKQFKDAGILEPQEFALKQNGEKKVLVDGFLAVNREKLNALSDYRLAKWARLGYIGVIDRHLYSFKNLRLLLEKAYVPK